MAGPRSGAVARGTDHARRHQGLMPRVRSDRQIRRGERVRGRAGPGRLGRGAIWCKGFEKGEARKPTTVPQAQCREAQAAHIRGAHGAAEPTQARLYTARCISPADLFFGPRTQPGPGFLGPAPGAQPASPRLGSRVQLSSCAAEPQLHAAATPAPSRSRARRPRHSPGPALRLVPGA